MKTVAEAALLIGKSRQWVYGQVSSGRIMAVTDVLPDGRKKCLIPQTEIDKVLSTEKQGQTTDLTSCLQRIDNLVDTDLTSVDSIQLARFFLVEEMEKQLTASANEKKWLMEKIDQLETKKEADYRKYRKTLDALRRENARLKSPWRRFRFWFWGY